MLKIFDKLKKSTNKDRTFLESVQIQVIGADDVFQEYISKCNILKEKVKIVREFDEQVSRKYIYSPNHHPMDANQMLEVVYTLLGRDLDYVIVSNTLDDYPVVGAYSLEDAVVFDSFIPNGLVGIRKGKSSLCGKLLRLSGYRKDETTFDITTEVSGISLLQESYLITKNAQVPVYCSVNMNYKFEKRKKMVFVMPIFMAVGGVERNTIEIMRSLQEDYQFCVITMERHAKGQGSLNYQLKGLCEANFDLKELVEFDDFFDAFRRLKLMYKPDVIWLCNNSPWLEANLPEFRNVFKEQAIIAQDVYDTKYGWIEYYHSEGIHSLDGYIAINKKIEEAFIQEYHLPKEKIDVIYPAVDDKKIRNEIAIPVDRVAICKKYGLNPDKKHFTYVGRLTSQKNPLRYSQLAEQALADYNDMEWVIVGDGELAGDVEQYIKEHELESRLIRLPYVANVPELYKVIDGLVIVSYYEGMPIVSIEAMSMGVPIFGTDVGDLKIFVDKINCGNIISIENKDDFAEFEKWYLNYNTYKKNAVEHSIEILDFFSANNLAELYKVSFEKGMKQRRTCSV